MSLRSKAFTESPKAPGTRPGATRLRGERIPGIPEKLNTKKVEGVEEKAKGKYPGTAKPRNPET